MSKDTNERESESKLNRRRILQFLGTGVLSASGLGGVSSASPSTKEGVKSYDTVELTSREKKKTIANARRTSKFKQLRKHFKKEYNLKVDKSAVSAYDLTIGSDSEIEKYQIATFPLEYKKGDAEIVIGLQNGEFVGYKSGMIDIDEKKEIAHITIASVESGQARSQDTRVDLSKKPGRGDDVTPQISKCDICIEVVHFVCDNGCSLSSFVICLGIGLAGGAVGAACSLVSAYVCWKIDYPADCQRNTARGLCRYYNYC